VDNGVVIIRKGRRGVETFPYRPSDVWECPTCGCVFRLTPLATKVRIVDGRMPTGQPVALPNGQQHVPSVPCRVATTECPTCGVPMQMTATAEEQHEADDEEPSETAAQDEAPATLQGLGLVPAR
jgi:hypothetical protein